MNIFERAARGKLRFMSTVGELTTEQLWDLPLTAKGEKPDLDRIAQGIYRELKGSEEMSFVVVKPDPRKVENELKLEIVKHVIEAKLTAEAIGKKAAETAERKRKLLAALAQKEDSELQGMTREQIQAQIAALDAA